MSRGPRHRRSVRLLLPHGGEIRITAPRARELLKTKQAAQVSQSPFVIRLHESKRKRFQELVRWSPKSKGFVMNGALLTSKAAQL